MLRNVLEDYLNSINERDFDYPLTALLQAMGFYDIHLTHGKTEFGKDFIAKKSVDSTLYQYSIQSKKGDIKQKAFRDEILGQLMEASLLGIGHPQFDRDLPRRVIFVATGRLVDNAALSFQDMNLELSRKFEKNPVEFWGHERLAELSEEFGLSGIHQNTIKGIRGFAQFYLVYSKAIEGNLSEREIEEYSCLWLDDSLDYKKRILRAAIEAEILAVKLIEGSHLYEATVVYLALARAVMDATYQNDDPFVKEILAETMNARLVPSCRRFLNELKSSWNEQDKSLIHLCIRDSPFPMVHYLVWCARISEIASLLFFLTDDPEEKANAISFLCEFIDKEPGAGHVPSDRYAISVVWTALALMSTNQVKEARHFVQKALVWLCDQVEKGFGLARYEADEFEVTKALVGYPFEFIEVAKNRSSYLATVIADLAAFFGDAEFYSDVVNDIEACEIVYNYWQVPDTKAALFMINSAEVISYPNVPHQFSLDGESYAEHIKHEPDSFQIADTSGVGCLIILSILLRDRYFPKLWNRLAEQHGRSVAA